MTLQNHKYLLIFIGLLISSFLFYNRFIRERMPRPLPSSLSTYQIILYTGLFLISLLIFITIIYRWIVSENTVAKEIQLKFIKAEKLRNILVNWIVKIRSLPKTISDMIKSSFREFHEFLVTPIPNYILSHLRITNYFLDFDNKEKLLVLVMFLYLPQLLVSISFIIDVLYVHKWSGFYGVLICLGYPMIFKAYIGILNQIYETNFEVLCSCIAVGYDPITKESWLSFTGNDDEIDGQGEG